MNGRLPGGGSGGGPVVGVLLAAGRSTRMGSMKQLLPWPPPEATKSRSHVPFVTTVVAAAFDSIALCCDHMIVVLGHEAEKVQAALAPRRFTIALSDATSPMLASVRLGLAASTAFNPTIIVILPADHPGLAAATITMLMDRARVVQGRAIIPEHGGKGGHPVIIPPSCVPSIMSCDDEGGLAGLWRRSPDLCERIAVNDPGVVRNLDTPEDYRRGGSAIRP